MTSEAQLFADAEMIETMSQAGMELPLPVSDMKKDARTSFTADSPYYTSYVEKEMRQVEVLSETLKDISARAKTFGKYGALMAESTRRLASACRLEKQRHQQQRTNSNTSERAASASDDEGDVSASKRQEQEDRSLEERRDAVGEEMTSVLTLLAEVLDEIATAQVQMVKSLEASLVVSLESFADTEMQQVSLLKADAESVTEGAEASYSRYLNGRYAVNGSPVDSWNKLSEQVSFQISPFIPKWKLNAPNGAAAAAADSPSTDRLSLKHWRSSSNKDDSSSKNRKGSLHSSLFQVSTAANLQLTLEQIRLAQTSAELKRFQLLKKLVSIKKRRNFELGESALASLHGIRAYFNNCSDLVQGLAPRLNRIQATQATLRETHATSQAPWEQREQSLERAVDFVGRAADEASQKCEAVAQGDVDVNQAISLDEIEQAAQLWQLPRMLAESSWYQRDPAPGVLVEGWLYKKSSSRMSLTQWSRRWFMMTKDGIYYFHSSADIKKANNGGYLHTLERVKICDTVLCMVRELQEQGLRFRFEIVTPNQRPLQLQARGPEEYKMWVEGIRTGAENQLVHGDVSPDSLMQGLGKKKKKKGGAEENTLGSMVQGEAQEDSVPMAAPQFREDEGDGEPKSIVSNEKQPRNPMVEEILHANPVCADCGAPSPDWACINLGVLVCIECSGVHRSLGVHLSKVRSLRLDSLSDWEGRLLLCLGNDRVNPIWEAGLESQRGWKKPTGDDSRKVKEDWIKSKYQWKGFLEVDPSRNQAERIERFNCELYDAASQGNLLGVAEALAHGGSVEWKNVEGKTPLHACAVSKPEHDEDDEWQGIECAELMIQNGAKMKALDDDHQSPLDCAVIGGAEREMIEFLSARSL